MKKSLIILSGFCVLFVGLMFYMANFYNTLGSFKIRNVEVVDGVLTVNVDKVKNALNYQVNITDTEGNVLLDKESENNRVSINELETNYEESYLVSVVASNEKMSKSAKSVFEYISLSPSIDRDNEHLIINDNNVLLKIKGDIKSSEYRLVLKWGDIIIYNELVDTNLMLIDNDVVADFKDKIVATLLDENNNVVSTFNVYNDPMIVSDISITSGDTSVYWNDLVVKYSGGDNATSYILDVYEGKKIVAKVKGDESKAVVPASYLKKNTKYKVVITAIFEDYLDIAKKDSVKIEVLDKETTNPPMVNSNYSNLKSGSEIVLSSNTDGASIKYTLNGLDPLKYGKMYKEPIVVDKNMTLKAYAYKDNMKNSVVSTYELVIGSEVPIIYLSPSNQGANHGVKEVGYSTEKDEMNDLADYLEFKLKQAGFKVYRNDPNYKMDTWLSESRNVGSDLHFAIHSNASELHDTKGMEIYVDNYNSPALSVASVIYNNLYEIYPNKDDTTDRGVKYAEGSLGEVNPLNIKNGILIEVAFHDNYDDAKWMVINKKDIGNNIANSLIDYYQMK